MLLLAASLAILVSLAAGGAHRSFGDYDNAAVDYLPLEKFLRQRDLQSCLSDSPADILFVADGSQSVGLTDFHLVVKSVLVDTVSKLRLGPNLVQVGVLVFSDQVSQTIPIGKFEDKRQLLRAVSNLAYVGSYTSMEAAVEGSVSELRRRTAELNSTSTQQVAEQRKTIVVFVTDGWANHGSSLYLSEMLGELQSQVTGVVALGLENANSAALRQLATDPTLVFSPIAYPDYLAAVFNLLNSRCSSTCYRFEQQKQEVHRVIMTLAQYINRLVENYATYKRQEHGLLQYLHELSASIAGVEVNINNTCGTSDVTIEKIVDLRRKISKSVTNSAFNGTTADVFISKLIQKLNSEQQEIFQLKRKWTVEKSRYSVLVVEEQRVKEELQGKVSAQVALRQANEAKLKALEDRIANAEQQMLSIASAMNQSSNATEQLTLRLQQQELRYSERLKEMRLLAQTHATLLTVQSGGSAQFTGLQRQIDTCETYLRQRHTVLFAIRCGSGASFESLFRREEQTFGQLTDQTLTVYKSSLLRHLHTMGFFSEVSLQFLVGGSVVATITMDTSRFELANAFTKSRVAASYPWVATYINSVYSCSLSSFQLQQRAEFQLIFGDLSRYERTQSCEDLVGVYVVLQKPHRCFPDATTFPQVYISTSPYGGRFELRVDEFRIVTKQPPTEKLLPTAETTEKQMSEILLYVRSGAGYLHPLLLSPTYTAASVLADIDDISQLTQHYKSSLLAKAAPSNYDTVRVQLFDAAENEVARLEFRGPFEHEHHAHGSVGEVGATHEAWNWFSPRHLHSASPFDVGQLRVATFRFYDGKEFFSIGSHMAGGCERRRYFMTVVDNLSHCRCFKEKQPPTVYFSDAAQPQACDRLSTARSLRITAFLRQLVG